MQEKVKFRSTRPNTSVVASDGTKLTFTGRYLVLDDPAHIAYMRAETRSFAGIIEEVPMEEQDVVDTLAEIKRRAIQEYLEQNAASTAPKEDSEYKSELKPMSTEGLAAVAGNPGRTIKVTK